MRKSTGASSAGKSENGPSDASPVGTNVPWKASWSALPLLSSESGTFTTPGEVRLVSCGRNGTGPWKATLPCPSRTVTSGA